jgi:hypothetical protein
VAWLRKVGNGDADVQSRLSFLEPDVEFEIVGGEARSVFLRFRTRGSLAAKSPESYKTAEGDASLVLPLDRSAVEASAVALAREMARWPER